MLKNGWVCSPDFYGKEPLKILHRQNDSDFVYAEHPEALMGRHTLFRQRVTLAESPASAILTISADDICRRSV